MIRETRGPWSVAEPHLDRRSRSFLCSVEQCRQSIDFAENVHKLRVASRRLEAALTAFDGQVSGEGSYDVKRQVRRIRRAAGRVRDLDVLILRLEKTSRAKRVVSALRERRRQLADKLRSRLSDRKQDPLRRALAELTREHHPETTTDLAQWAAGQMQPVASDFLDAAGNDLRGIRDLHRLRLCGKRLRYSLELFRDELAPEQVSCLLKSLQGVQERLGDMNDHASAQELLSDVAESADKRAVRERAQKLAKREKRMMKRDRRQFLAWWRSGAADSMIECVRKTIPADAAVASAS